ncbi:c-type cytochrome [Pedobacter sp. HX-22-1]|uniref:C-type cytochrome n=2 Tax=Pedobacter puniceum TaxID=2666136 RepID=A0A7K0FNS2_9SPHI|nr:c-type cytochrome [Pedobacter puniceum]
MASCFIVMITRQKIIVYSCLLLCLTVMLFCSERKQPIAYTTEFVENNLKAFEVAITKLSEEANKSEISESELKEKFLEARSVYKKIEFYIEYFFPASSRVINGVPIAEIELGENFIEPPGGLQVIEDYIYNPIGAEEKKELENEINKLALVIKKINLYQKEYIITDEQLFDAIRLEIFRITALGITGFDTPLSLHALPETSLALEGLKKVLSQYQYHEKVKKQIESAQDFISKENDFNQFDRLAFITNYLQPLSLALHQQRKQLNLDTVESSAALYNDAISLFQENAFNPNKFVGNYTEFLTQEKILLGEKLFNDKVLSGANNISCASCHHENKAFTDGLKTAKGLSKNNLLRNTPTLLYAGFQRGFFYDLKAGSLEDQALDVVHHKDEMDGSLQEISKKVQQQTAYKKLFKMAYENEEITPWKIQHALASYVRSLAPFSSRFDKYMRGDKTQLSDVEKRGFNLFTGKAKCATCHFMPLFNGTPAPLFDKTEVEVLGVPLTPDTVNAKIDTDLGKYALNKYNQYLYAFKTPTLRNIAKTAPYMHNGVYKDLNQVMDFYNRGGGAGLGIALDNQTLLDTKLNLSASEINDIISFMKTLNDE